MNHAEFCGVSTPAKRIDRRDFGRQLWTGAAVMPMASGGASADPQTPQEPVVASVEDQLVSMLQSRFGDRLSEEQWKLVRAKIAGQLAAAKSLREFKLINANEPATIFAVQPPA
jgi:hypothetical protein